MTYQEQLKHPKWQKKRLEILDRDQWTCQTCGDTEATLTVHHKSYRMLDGEFLPVWEYDGGWLITLCEDCHSKEEAKLEQHKKYLFFKLRAVFENADSLAEMSKFFQAMSFRTDRRITSKDIEQIKESTLEYFYREGNKRNYCEGDSLTDMFKKLMGEDCDE